MSPGPSEVSTQGQLLGLGPFLLSMYHFNSFVRFYLTPLFLYKFYRDKLLHVLCPNSPGQRFSGISCV